MQERSCVRVCVHVCCLANSLTWKRSLITMTLTYSDRMAKKNAWETVIREFIVDSDCKTPTEKKEIAAAVHRKWKHLGDSFTREVAKKKQEARSGSGATARKAYIYFDQLKFLQTAIKTTNSSLDDEQSQNRTLAADHDSSRDTQSCGSPELDEAEASSQKRKKITKKTAHESDDLLLHTLKKQFLQKQQEHSDEDCLFMLSLVAELKKLPEHVKLEVKYSIMTTISNARMQEFRSQQYSSSFRHTPNHYNSYHEDPPTHATGSNQEAWTPSFHPHNSGQQPTFHSHDSRKQQAWSTQPIVKNVERNVTVTVPVTIRCGAVSQARPHQEHMSMSSNCQANSPESELSEYDFS